VEPTVITRDAGTSNLGDGPPFLLVSTSIGGHAMERVEIGTGATAFLRIGGRDVDHGVIRSLAVAFAQAAVVIG
jgi:hypothetical protein